MLHIGLLQLSKSTTTYIKDIFEKEISKLSAWEMQIYESVEAVKNGFEETRSKPDLMIADYENEMLDELRAWMDGKGWSPVWLFVSEEDTNVYECFRRTALPYILKPLQEQDMIRVIGEYLSSQKQEYAYFQMMCKGELINIPLETIAYFESNYRTIIVHTQYQTYKFYDQLNAVEKRLEQYHFLRCHQSYLVNLDWITDYDGKNIQVGEATIPISYKNLKSVKEYLVAQEIAACDENGNLLDGTNSKLAKVLSGSFDLSGSLICVSGSKLGQTIRLVPEQEIVVGRDEEVADLIVELPEVSRKHCAIIYHSEDDCYEITDYSLNGTYVDGNMRLVTGDTYQLKPGSIIAFGADQLQYRLC